MQDDLLEVEPGHEAVHPERRKVIRRRLAAVLVRARGRVARIEPGFEQRNLGREVEERLDPLARVVVGRRVRQDVRQRWAQAGDVRKYLTADEYRLAVDELCMRMQLTEPHLEDGHCAAHERVEPAIEDDLVRLLVENRALEREQTRLDQSKGGASIVSAVTRAKSPRT